MRITKEYLSVEYLTWAWTKQKFYFKIQMLFGVVNMFGIIQPTLLGYETAAWKIEPLIHVQYLYVLLCSFASEIQHSNWGGTAINFIYPCPLLSCIIIGCHSFSSTNFSPTYRGEKCDLCRVRNGFGLPPFLLASLILVWNEMD